MNKIDVDNLLTSFKDSRALFKAGVSGNTSLYVWSVADLPDKVFHAIVYSDVAVLLRRGEPIQDREGVKIKKAYSAWTLGELIDLLSIKYPEGEVTVSLARTQAERISDVVQLLLKAVK